MSAFMLKYWWVIAFVLFCGIIYERSLKSKESEFHSLQTNFNVLQSEKQTALQQQQTLQRQINSQSDPAWIELTLMKGLGVCPEDQQKVYFE